MQRREPGDTRAAREHYGTAACSSSTLDAIELVACFRRYYCT